MRNRQSILRHRTPISGHAFGGLLVTVLLSVFISGCSSNAFTSQEKKDPAEDAAIALENDNADKAITILESALQDEPGNLTYISLLAMAYGQRAGVDPISFIENMAASEEEGSSSGNGLTSMFGIMPAATNETIADVDYALELLAQIPAESITNADKLKLALFQTAATVLRVKILDTNGNGVIDPSEALAMTADSALAILTQLATASTLFAGGIGAGESGDSAGSKISSIQNAIDSQDGATPEEKLQAYIISGSTPPSP